MGRQRTINDQNFWSSPRLYSCTTEDKVALLHLLTCPMSNIVGAYAIVPRIAGAEIGWTHDQWLQVIDRLCSADLAWYDHQRMFVWVRIWWEHHNASQTLGPKLRARTMAEIRRLPPPWEQTFLADYRVRLSHEHRAVLDAALHEEGSPDTVSLPYPEAVDTQSDFSRRNTNTNLNSKETTTPATRPAAPVDNSCIPDAHIPTVMAALAKAQQQGLARAEPQAVVNAVAKQFKSKSPPRDPAALAFFLSQNLAVGPVETTSTATRPQASDDELAALKGRCFAWPSSNPTCYARVVDDGNYELFSLEDGQFVRRYGHVVREGLLTKIRAGQVREVSSAIVDEVARGLVA